MSLICISVLLAFECVFSMVNAMPPKINDACIGLSYCVEDNMDSLMFDSLLYINDLDERNIEKPIGVIPDDNYCDQGYIVRLHNKWIAVLTTGPGKEAGFKYIVSSVSLDEGKTWTPMQVIDDKRMGTAWAIPYVTSYGRIYVIYCRNRKFCFKYSDDQGRTWSPFRYEIPVRYTNVDNINDLDNGQQYFWSICKPFCLDGELYFSFTKYALRNMELGEGWLFKSSNIESERDPNKIFWEMLPRGDMGIKSDEFGRVQEEHNMVYLSDGKLYMVFRTNNGYIGSSYSADRGYTWTSPQYVTYRDGSYIKHPRACPRLFRCSNGKYLMWIHNTNKIEWWNYRNPAWIVGGIEEQGEIKWSYPEILMYANDSTVKMSYPDMIDYDGKYWMTETQKTVCGVHQISSKLLNDIWKQHYISERSMNGLILDVVPQKRNLKYKVNKFSGLNDGSFTVDLWLDFNSCFPGDIIIDGRNDIGDGFYISIGGNNNVCFSLRCGELSKDWSTDVGLLSKETLQHVAFIIDGGPCIMTTVVNGKFCDGGRMRHKGWCWFDAGFKQLDMLNEICLNNLKGGVVKMCIYNRYLTTTEAIGNYRFGLTSLRTDSVTYNENSIVSGMNYLE